MTKEASFRVGQADRFHPARAAIAMPNRHTATPASVTWPGVEQAISPMLEPTGRLGRLEDLVADVGDSYLKRDFQYRSIGRFTVMAPDVLIGFVDQVRAASGN